VKSSLLQRSSKVGPQLCHKNHGPLFDCITRMCVRVCVCCGAVCRGHGVFKTVTPSSSAAGRRLTVAVVFNDSITVLTGFTFTFIAGPVITHITPRQYLYTSVSLSTLAIKRNVQIHISLQILTCWTTYTQRRFLPRCMECRRSLAMKILSVRPSVCQTRGLRQNGRKICLDFYTIRKIIYLA